MVMVVSTAGLTGRGRVEPIALGNHGQGMYGWIDSGADETPDRKEALAKATRKVRNRQSYLRKKERKNRS